jgi:plastocyanin
MRFTSLLVLLATAACGGGSDGGTPPATSTPTTLSIAPVTTSIASLGDTRTLTAAVTDQNGAAMPNATVSWSTSDQAILTVSPTTGSSTTVTSHGNGNATITASASPATGQVAFTVAQLFSSLGLTPATISIAPGATGQLTAAALDAKGTAITGGATGTTFLSGNTGAATVDASGVVHGVANGTSTVTATLVRNGLTRTATSAITVAAAPIFPGTASVAATPSITFNPAVVDIAAGGTVTWDFGSLTHNVTFDAATGRPANITASTNTSVARTFATAGTFSYQCTIHPGMTGTVNVH